MDYDMIGVLVKDKNFWSARASREIRLIYHRVRVA